MQLSEQWVLVTGGARGLGQAITRALAREGAGVVINYHRSEAAALALAEELGEPLMSVSLVMPGDSLPLSDPYEMRDRLEKQVDLIIDGGYGGLEASTVINLADGQPEVLRVGCGDPSPFEELP